MYNNIIQSPSFYKFDPVIVKKIEKSSEKGQIYKYIYDNVVSYCVRRIEENDFEVAYSSYLALEEQFVKSISRQKVLKNLSLS